MNKNIKDKLTWKEFNHRIDKIFSLIEKLLINSEDVPNKRR